MSNGLPSYGRYLARPSLAELSVELASEGGFPFRFALVTFADATLPVVVFDGQVHPFLTPGDARRLVDANGEPVVEAAPETVSDPTRSLRVQNAAGSDPVFVSAYEEGAGAVDLFVTSQGAGLAVLAASEGAVAAVADDASGLRAVRRSAATGVPVKALFVDHIPESALTTGDGAIVALRVLPEGEPFGGSPITLGSISARVQDPGGTPSSSIDIDVIGGPALTLNAAGGVVHGALTTDRIVYDTSMAAAERAVGTETATSSSTTWTVANNHVTTTSIITITPRAELEGATQWWVTITTDDEFVVNFDAALTANWTFDYEVKDVSAAS